jgi:hypothetical protein
MRKPIRIKASDHTYSPPNVAYLHETPTGWRCTLANGTPAAFSYAGIRGDETAARFALEDCETGEQALAAVRQHGARYLSGPKQGETVYTYELVSPRAPAAQAPAVAYSEANMETAMCLWEAVQDLLGSNDPLAQALIEEAGTPSARHVVIAWVEECKAAWEEARAAGTEQEPYDWEHCPAFLKRKLSERYPD